jgi:hypothetical protein
VRGGGGVKQPTPSGRGTDREDEERTVMDATTAKPKSSAGGGLSGEEELSIEEKRAIEERLRYLGYID